MTQERTGWPPGMLQDDSRELSQWLANRPGARGLIEQHMAERLPCIGPCGNDCDADQGRSRCADCTAWPRHDRDGHQLLRDLAVAVGMVASAVTVVVFAPEIVGWILGVL